MIQVAVLSNDVAARRSPSVRRTEGGSRRPRRSAGGYARGIRAGRARRRRPRRAPVAGRSGSLPQAESAARASCSIASSLDPHLMLEAMRAGVTECLAGADHATGARSSRASCARGRRPRAARPRDRVCRREGRRGDDDARREHGRRAGARRRRRSAAGRSAHGSGDAALFLGAEPRFTVVDVLENVHRLDDAFFSGIVEKTKVGAEFLGSSDRVSPSAASTRSGFAPCSISRCASTASRCSTSPGPTSRRSTRSRSPRRSSW